MKKIVLNLFFNLILISGFQIYGQNYDIPDTLQSSGYRNLTWNETIQSIKSEMWGETLGNTKYSLKFKKREIINDSLLVFEHQGKNLQFNLKKLEIVCIVSKKPKKINSKITIYAWIIQLHFRDNERKYHGIYIESKASFRRLSIPRFASLFQHLVDLNQQR